MAERYEFLDRNRARLVADRETLLLLDPFIPWQDGDIALVIGNPRATAGVLAGTREDVATTLRALLAMVEQPAPRT